MGSDDIAFERDHQVVDRVSRVEVGAVVVEEYATSGVLAVTVRGSCADVVGRWETGWIGKGSIRRLSSPAPSLLASGDPGGSPGAVGLQGRSPWVRERVR